MKVNWIFILIIAISCKSKEIDIGIKYDGDKLVVNSVLAANEPIILQLQKSYRPSGTSVFDKKLINPKVELFKNDQFYGALKQDSLGYFSIDYLPKEGDILRFVCSAESFPIAISKNVIIPDEPKTLKINVSETIKSFQNPSYNAKSVSLELDFIQNKNYLISFWGKTNQGSLRLNTYSIFNSEVENPCERSFFNQTLVTEKCQKENKYKLTKGVELKTYDEKFNEYNFKNILIKIVSVDDAFAQYILTYQDGFDEITDAFSARYNRFTNIENGYGIVVAKNTLEITQ